MKHLKFIVIFLSILFNTTYAQQDSEKINSRSHQDSVSSLKKKFGLSQARFSICVLNFSTGDFIYKEDENKPMIPASNMKIITSVVALDLLGVDYKFKTRVYTNGTITPDGTLQGSLIVKGSGDPNISGRFYQDNPLMVFQSLSQSIKKRGIKNISGDIILDNSAFDNEFVNKDWPKNQLDKWYCAPISAISFNDNCIDIIFDTSSKASNKPLITFSPDTKYYTLVNNTSFTDFKDKHNYSITREDYKITISNKIWKGAKENVHWYPVHNPPEYFGFVLRETLQSEGLVVSGSIVVLDKPYDTTDKNIKVVAEIVSTLNQSLNVMNKNSQNFYAEQILKTIAYEKKGLGSFELGTSIITEFLRDKIGIDATQFKITDGSGLARTNRLSSLAIVNTLEYIYKSSNRETFVKSLSLAGVDGSLKNRLKETMEKKVKVSAKTGYIAGASSLSGYIFKENGNSYAFSVLINDFKSYEDTKKFQDEFVKLFIKSEN